MSAALALSAFAGVAAQTAIPRTADGRPNLQGVWQVVNRAGDDLEAGFVDGGKIPYSPAAAEQRAKNLQNRTTSDPLSK